MELELTLSIRGQGNRKGERILSCLKLELTLSAKSKVMCAKETQEIKRREIYIYKFLELELTPSRKSKVMCAKEM